MSNQLNNKNNEKTNSKTTGNNDLVKSNKAFSHKHD